MIEDYRKSFKITTQPTGHYLWYSTKNTNGIQMLLDVTMKSEALTSREKPLEARTQKQRFSRCYRDWEKTHPCSISRCLLTYCLHRDKPLPITLSFLPNPARKPMAHFNELLQFHYKRTFIKYFEKHYKFKVFPQSVCNGDKNQTAFEPYSQWLHFISSYTSLFYHRTVIPRNLKNELSLQKCRHISILNNKTPILETLNNLQAFIRFNILCCWNYQLAAQNRKLLFMEH